MRGRGHQSDGVEQRAAADGDDEGVAIDAVLEDLALDLLDKAKIVLDLLAAGHGLRRRHQLDMPGMLRRVGFDFAAEAGGNADQAFIQENQAAMPSVRLQPRDRVDERPVLRLEQAAREYDGELVRDGKTLPISRFIFFVAKGIFRQDGLLRTHG